MSSWANSTFAESELKNHPVDDAKLWQMKSQIKIDSKNKTFHIEINIPGFDDDEIDVFVNKGKLIINAVSKKEFQNFNLCKVYKVSFNLPANNLIKNFERVLEEGELQIKGMLLDQTSNGMETENWEKIQKTTFIDL